MSVVLNNVFSLHLALLLKNEQKKQIIYPRQRQNLEHLEESGTASTIKAEHDISQSIPKKTLKRDNWSNNEIGAFINAWKENFYEIETYRQPSAWLKVKAVVNNHALEKSLKQIKAKLGRSKMRTSK